MMANPKRSSTLVLRLIVGLALLGWPRVGSAQGTWSVVSLPPKPGEVSHLHALAVDTEGNLYVADQPAPDNQYTGRIQRRDDQGICYENRIPGPVQARGTPTAPRLAEATGR